MRESDINDEEDEGELRRRIVAHVERHSVPDRPLRASPRGRALSHAVLSGLATIVVVLLAVGVGQLIGAYRASSAAESSPDPSLPALRSPLEREQAIAVVRATASIGRVDRVDAKLMAYAEYVAVAGPVRTHEGDPRKTATVGFGMTGDPDLRYIWVVAVAGEVWPAGRHPVVFGGPVGAAGTPYPPYRWATFLVDAESAQLIVVGDAGIVENWPPTFGSLPAHPVQH